MTQGLDGISNGILNEIASAFSKPRNDEFWGILEFILGILVFILGILEFFCDDIPQSSWGMTQGLDGILNEIASAFSKPRNDEFCGILEFILGILAKRLGLRVDFHRNFVLASARQR